MATEDDIHAWIKDYPREWDQLCQALMWQMCNHFGTVAPWTNASAIDAYQVEYEAGRISHTSAPDGSFVYLDIGKDGHVGFVMNGGRVFMATSHLAEEWTASDAGWNSLEEYIKATGATYLGWSYLNGGNTMNWQSDTAGEENMFVTIQGRQGAIRGGMYYIEDGVATFLGTGGKTDVELTADQGIALRARVTGI